MQGREQGRGLRSRERGLRTKGMWAMELKAWGYNPASGGGGQQGGRFLTYNHFLTIHMYNFEEKKT